MLACAIVKKCVIMMLVMCFPVIVGCGSGGGGSIPVGNSQEVKVSALLKEVQAAIDIVDRKTGGEGPAFRKAVITVSTEKVITKTGKVTLVLSVSSSRAKARGQKMVLELKPRGRAFRKDNDRTGKALANQILEAVSAVNQQSKLKISRLSVSANLQVVKTRNAGIEIEISGVALDGSSAQSSRTSLHSIELIYGDET